MAQSTRRICLLGPTTITTSGTGPDIVLPGVFSAATVSVVLSTTSGTSPTFDLFIQQQLPQAASTDTSGNPPSGTGVYDDILHFTQLTTNSTRVAKLGSQYIPANTANATTLTTADWAQQDAALGAATLRLGPIGGDWRMKWTVGGTSPSTVMAVVAEFIPYGS